MSSNQVVALLTISLLVSPALANKIQKRGFDRMFPNRQAWGAQTQAEIDWRGERIAILAYSEVTLGDIDFTDSQLAFLDRMKSLETLNLLNVTSTERIQACPRLVALARNHIRRRLQRSVLSVYSSKMPLSELVEGLYDIGPGRDFAIRSTPFKNNIGAGVDLECAFVGPCNDRPLLDVIEEACEKQGWTMTIEMQGIRITAKK